MPICQGVRSLLLSHQVPNRYIFFDATSQHTCHNCFTSYLLPLRLGPFSLITWINQLMAAPVKVFFVSSIFTLIVLMSKTINLRSRVVETTDDEPHSCTRQDLCFSYTLLQASLHIYHSRLYSPSHCHVYSNTCHIHIWIQVLIFPSTSRLRIAGDYAL